MSFSDETVRKAFTRSQGRCECTRGTHNHPYIRCARWLIWLNRGRNGNGAWEANHINRVESEGHDGLSNCEILCWPCHEATF